jgi:hypothetical protein
MYLARASLGRRPTWNVTFSKATGYNHNLVLKVASKLLELMESEESKSIKTKFEHSRYMGVGGQPL